MDTIEKVESNIKQYIQEKFNFSSQDNISLKLIRMNSLSNDIYHSIVTDTTTNEIIDEICYRNFGEIGDIVNRLSYFILLFSPLFHFVYRLLI